jgi:isopenicillin N synthase-like dioxygenase
MIEKYFCSPMEYKLGHQRSNYQAGITPEGVETPRCMSDKDMQEKMKELLEENRPSAPLGPDVKWRYSWTPQNRSQEPVIPEGFPEWEERMDLWGNKMIAALEVVAEMAALGFGFPKDAFTSLMNQGPHLLGPTGSDLVKYGQEGTILAGYHYDLNFLTIHGKSNFPGLNLWLSNGKKIEVKVPMGCLLVQTGKQMEWFTGGECKASMHDVVVSKETLHAIKLAQEQNRCLWRVSSTLFGHIASNAILQPIGYFANSPLARKYPPLCADEYVRQEVVAIIYVKGQK